MNKKTYIAPSFEIDIFSERCSIMTASENAGTDFDTGFGGEYGPGEF